MNEARKKILQLLADGRISVDEADDLLAALEGGTSTSAKEGGSTEDRETGRGNIWSDIEFDFEGLGERIHQSVLKGLERVEQELRDLEIRVRREDWPRSWKMGGRGRTGRSDSQTSTTEQAKPSGGPTDQPEATAADAPPPADASGGSST